MRNRAITRDRSRSRSPVRNDRNRSSRFRSRSPPPTYEDEVLRFKKSESEALSISGYSERKHSVTPVPPTRPALPFYDNVDQYGIPIFPLEPEPKATEYGSMSLIKLAHLIYDASLNSNNANVYIGDIYGLAIRPYSKKSGPKFPRNLKSSYPSVPNFFTGNLPSYVSELITNSRRQTLAAANKDAALEPETAAVTVKNTSVPISAKVINLNEASNRTAPTGELQHLTSCNIAPVISNALREIHNLPVSNNKPEKEARIDEDDLIDLDWDVSDDLIDLSDNRVPVIAPQSTAISSNSFHIPQENAIQSNILSRDPYMTLGVKWGASTADVLAAYDELMLSIQLERNSSERTPATDAEFQKRAETLDIARRRILNY